MSPPCPCWATIDRECRRTFAASNPKVIIQKKFHKVLEQTLIMRESNLGVKNFLEVMPVLGNTQGMTAKSAAEIDAIVALWQQEVANYVKEKRRLSGKNQKEISGSVRKTISAIENAKSNFTLRTLIETLVEVGGNVSDAFRAATPQRYDNVHHEMIHTQLQRILEKAPPDAVNWITGNIKTFWQLYVSPKS